MIKMLIKLIVAVAAVPIAFGVSFAFYNNIILIKELAGSLKYFLFLTNLLRRFPKEKKSVSM